MYSTQILELEHLQNDLMYKSDLSHNLTDASKSDIYFMCSSSDIAVLPTQNKIKKSE